MAESYSDPSGRKRKPNLQAENFVKRQLWSHDNDVSCNFNELRRALHVSCTPETIVCRSFEEQSLECFMTERCNDGKPGIMYVCGPPGTGKSLLVNKVKRKVLDPMVLDGKSVSVASINCMATEPGKIFQKISVKLSEENENMIRKENALKIPSSMAKAKLISYARASKSTFFLILDEMDQLMSKDQSLLCELFGLANIPDSTFVIIGIANTIDLTDRILPKLKLQQTIPAVLKFSAYGKEQMLVILKQRLEEFEQPPFEDKALELCARKVSATSGDMRKALDVCRAAMDILESENKSSETEYLDAEEGNTGAKTQRKFQTVVKVGHMAKALSQTFKSPIVDQLQSLPQHQQLVLCSAAKLFTGKKKDTTLGQLNHSYCMTCKEVIMKPLTSSEFSGMCSVLADQALLCIGKGRDERLRRITLKIQKDDLVFALQGIRFFRSLLEAP